MTTRDHILNGAMNGSCCRPHAVILVKRGSYESPRMRESGVPVSETLLQSIEDSCPTHPLDEVVLVHRSNIDLD